MVKRILLYGLIVWLIGAVFLFAASTNYFKKSYYQDDNVQLHISNINKFVDNKDWTQAESELRTLEKAWGKVVKRIQFTGEEDDIKKISESIYKLHYLIKTEDLPSIKNEIGTLEYGWNDIGN